MPAPLDFHPIISQRILEPIPLKPWVFKTHYFFQCSVPKRKDHLVLLGSFWIQDGFIHRMTKDKISHTSLHLGSPAWSQCWSTVSLLVGCLLAPQLPSPRLSALLFDRIPWFSYWWKQRILEGKPAACGDGKQREGI